MNFTPAFFRDLKTWNLCLGACEKESPLFFEILEISRLESRSADDFKYSQKFPHSSVFS